MQAARFPGQGRIEIVETPAPEPRPGEALVAVEACALCGSDLRPLRQGWPVTPGHEVVGRVASRGHALEGRRVLVYIPVFCGACALCRRGDTHLCENAADLVGWQRPGGYAEALAVPDQCLIPVPDDVPSRMAPLLLDTVGTVGHGLRLVRRLVSEGPTLVVGAGPIGLGAVIAAQGLGLGPVAVAEPSAYRRGVAEELGAAPLDEADAGARFPVVVEASGKDAGRQRALEAVAPGGVVLQLGEADSWTIAETRAIRRKDFGVQRSFYFPLREMEENLVLFRAERPRYERLVDAAASLDGLEALFASFARGERLKPQLSLEG